MVQLLTLVAEWHTQEWRLLAAAATRAARLCAVPRGRWREERHVAVELLDWLTARSASTENRSTSL
jgi:hypothetical protein